MRSALERREEILFILSARKKDSIENLANEFNVFRRTIERDIAYLKSNHEIETIKGNGGGVYFYGKYTQRYLTDTQKHFLMEISNEFDPTGTQIINDILAAFSFKGKK